MNDYLQQKRIIKYWLAFFVAHLLLLTFAVFNVYAIRRLAPEGPSLFVTGDLVFNTSFLVSIGSFGVSFFSRKTFAGFVRALAFSLLISLIGLFVLFGLNSFYFLLWFIIGLLAMGIHLFRYQNLFGES